MNSEAETPRDVRSGGADRYVSLGFLTAAYMLSVTDRMILSVLFDPIKAEFDLTDTQLGLLGGLTFALFYATLGVPLAKLADRGDRRRLIAASLILFSLMTALSGLASGFMMLVLFRVFVGVGEAGVNPASQSIIADYFPASQRSFAMSFLTVGGNIGMVFGFLVGGLISQLYGWREAFFVVGTPGLLLGLALLVFLKDPPRGGADDLGKRVEREGATILEAARQMFLSPVLMHLLAASVLSGMVTYGILQWLPTYFGRVHDLSQGQIGLVMAFLLGAVGITGTLTGGRLVDILSRKRIDYGPLLIAATQIAAIPLFVLAYTASSFTMTIIFLTVPMFVLTFFLGPSLAFIQTYAPVEMRSLAAAIKMLCLNLVGLSLGPLIVGLLSDALEPSMGVDGLTVALCCLPSFSIWSAFHFWRAGKHMLALELDGQVNESITG